MIITHIDGYDYGYNGFTGGCNYPTNFGVNQEWVYNEVSGYGKQNFSQLANPPEVDTASIGPSLPLKVLGRSKIIHSGVAP